MAISTIDGAVAGAQPPQFYIKNGIAMSGIGRHHNLMYSTGLPGAQTAPSAGLNGAALTTKAGQIPFTNPVSGESRLMRFSAQSPVVGTMLLVDRLWENSSISSTTTTAQAITPAALPARDINGATNGDGVYAALEVSSTTTSANSTGSIIYTNSAGTGSKTATFTANAPNGLLASAPVGTWAIYPLAAGDLGVRSIQSITLATTLTAGTVHLVLFRILASVSVSVPNVENAIDLVTGGNVKMYDNTVPNLVWIPSATTLISPTGAFIYTQG